MHFAFPTTEEISRMGKAINEVETGKTSIVHRYGNSHLIALRVRHFSRKLAHLSMDDFVKELDGNPENPYRYLYASDAPKADGRFFWVTHPSMGTAPEFGTLALVGRSLEGLQREADILRGVLRHLGFTEFGPNLSGYLQVNRTSEINQAETTESSWGLAGAAERVQVGFKRTWQRMASLNRGISAVNRIEESSASLLMSFAGIAESAGVDPALVSHALGAWDSLDRDCRMVDQGEAIVSEDEIADRIRSCKSHEFIADRIREYATHIIREERLRFDAYMEKGSFDRRPPPKPGENGSEVLARHQRDCLRQRNDLAAAEALLDGDNTQGIALKRIHRLLGKLPEVDHYGNRSRLQVAKTALLLEGVMRAPLDRAADLARESLAQDPDVCRSGAEVSVCNHPNLRVHAEPMPESGLHGLPHFEIAHQPGANPRILLMPRASAERDGGGYRYSTRPVPDALIAPDRKMTTGEAMRKLMKKTELQAPDGGKPDQSGPVFH